MIHRSIAAALFLLLPFLAVADNSLVKLGKELYLTGQGLSASVAGGAPLPPAMAACVRCHRLSGYGGGEGDSRTASIAPEDLFMPLKPQRDRLLRDLYQERYSLLAKHDARTPRTRQAYNGAHDLGTALRSGFDPSGQTLSANMPRYAIAESEVNALTAYLRSLSILSAEGYDHEHWNFAAIFSPDVTEARKQAATDVINAFVDRHNRQIEDERLRPGFSPYYKGEYAEARRLFKIDIWQLHGPPSSWPKQLRTRYNNKPPFALLAGIVPLHYDVVANFCNTKQLPCIFPQTLSASPTTIDSSGFSLYLSEGLTEDARLIIEDLRRKAIHNVAIEVGASAEARFFKALFRTLAENQLRVVEHDEADAVIVSANSSEADVVIDSLPSDWGPRPIYVAGGLIINGDGSIGFKTKRKVNIAWRFSEPGTTNPNKHRLRSWLVKRNIYNPQYERTQFETWFALEVARHAIIKLVDRTSALFFLETIEHLTESVPNPLDYTSISLGPTQRIAATGGRIVIVN